MKLWLKAVPAVPFVVVGFVTLIIGQLMTKLYVAPIPIQPLLSVALTVMLKVPDCVGVPLNTPVLESIKPVGNVLDVLKVTLPIPPVCVKV